jgi:pimeloyl-ACP methyl ester carboxylesterase
MPPRRRIGRKFIRSFTPIVLVILLALIGFLGFATYCVTHPAKQPYLVTPQSFSKISGTVLKVTEESWSTLDGKQARGWLLKGASGSPAVVLLHTYGADRSWLFNLGVKINETTNFTILWPDLRGHGENPPVRWSSLGSREGDDVVAALNFLRTLKADNQSKLVDDRFGIYGTELGAYAALKAAGIDNQIRVLVLDSIPASPDQLLNSKITNCIGVDSDFLQSLSRAATKFYLMGAYENVSSCDLARLPRDPQILVLAGSDSGNLKQTTTDLQKCFQRSASVEVRTDLPLSGLNLPSATGEQGEAYDRIVIEFFDRNLVKSSPGRPAQ